MSPLIFESRVFFGLCEDGIFAEDDYASNVITWDTLFNEAVETFCDPDSGFVSPEDANELLVISTKLRRLADRLDNLALEKKCLPAC